MSLFEGRLRQFVLQRALVNHDVGVRAQWRHLLAATGVAQDDDLATGFFRPDHFFRQDLVG